MEKLKEIDNVFDIYIKGMSQSVLSDALFKKAELVAVICEKALEEKDIDKVEACFEKLKDINELLGESNRLMEKYIYELQDVLIKLQSNGFESELKDILSNLNINKN